jgi:hypothetical protein
MADKKEESTPKKPEKAKPIGEKVSIKNIEELRAAREKYNKLLEKGTELTEQEVADMRELGKAISITEKAQKKKNAEQERSRNIARETKKEFGSILTGIESISKVYSGLTSEQTRALTVSKQSLTTLLDSGKVTAEQAEYMQERVSDVGKMATLQQQLAETGPEDVERQKAISEEYKAQKKEILAKLEADFDSGLITKEQFVAMGKMVNEMDKGYSIATKLSTVSKEQKEIVEGQIAAYEGIKKTLKGIIATAQLFASGPAGMLRMTLVGAGVAMTKLGKTTREMGGFLGGATVSATALGTVFDSANDVAKGLSEEMGGLNDVTFQNQLNTNLMATNMGISGTEAAKLTGNLARLNGNSIETAQNLANGAKEMAKTAGVVPAAVMADMAASAEEFALFGKDGGKNMQQAAVQAAKMGVSLKTMSGVADNLLDFENSINSELELGAMLGKNINLDRARALAYEGDIAGATQETLDALGGVDAFNKMDYFQKKKTAELLGTSVEELQKMVTQQEEAATIGGQINGAFNSMTEGLTAITTGPLGGFVSGLSGAIGQTSEIAGNFKTAGDFAKDTFGKAKDFFGGKKPGAPDLPSNPTESITDSVTQSDDAGGKVSGPGEKAGDGLKSLAEGLEAMGTTKVLFGALNLIPTALGLLLMVVGIPSLLGIGAFGTNAGIALLYLAEGLEAMGTTKVLFGALTLIPTALGFALMTLGVIGLAGVALLGAPAGAGLIALGAGLASFGATAGTVGWLGVAVILALGAAFTLFAFGLSLLAPLVESIGNAIGSVVESIAAGIVMIVGSISDLLVNVLPLLNLEAAAGILAMAASFTVLAGSLALLSTMGLAAIPVLLAVGAVGAIGASLFGGGEGEGGAEGAEGGGDRTGELIDEIKGLRADLIAGKIAVNIDGQKVTSNIGKVVARNSSNSYAKV